MVMSTAVVGSEYTSAYSLARVAVNARVFCAAAFSGSMAAIESAK